MTDSRDDLSQCGCDMYDKDKKPKQRACSVPHVALVLVGVRRVTVVHIGLDDVVVVMYFCVDILFVMCCIRRCILYTPRR